MYKALITDLDGTAVGISSNGDDIDDRTIQAVAHGITAGKKITCATGREWSIAKPIITKLGIVSPCIVEGGTRVVDPLTEETLWEKSLELGASVNILQILKSSPSKGFIMHSSDIRQTPLDEIRFLPTRLRFLYLLAIPEGVAASMRDQINSQDYGVAHITPSWEGLGLVDLHVTHPEATKEHAIAIWQRMEGITKAETIGLGDSGNDIPIFQSSGLKVAVGTATDSLKQRADYIAPNVNDHALEHVITKFLL